MLIVAEAAAQRVQHRVIGTLVLAAEARHRHAIQRLRPSATSASPRATRSRRPSTRRSSLGNAPDGASRTGSRPTRARSTASPSPSATATTSPPPSAPGSAPSRCSTAACATLLLDRTGGEA
jgi:hypothetical protein